MMGGVNDWKAKGVFQAEVTSGARASGQCQLVFCREAERGQRWGQLTQVSGLQQVELGFEPRGMPLHLTKLWAKGEEMGSSGLGHWEVRGWEGDRGQLSEAHLTQGCAPCPSLRKAPARPGVPWVRTGSYAWEQHWGNLRVCFILSQALPGAAHTSRTTPQSGCPRSCLPSSCPDSVALAFSSSSSFISVHTFLTLVLG